MALSPELQALVALTTGEPLVQIEIHFPDSYVHRISDRAHSFGGNAYAADITGDVTWERSCDTKFSNLRFRVSNLDRAYTDLLTTYTSPELQEADVYCFETFAGATTREERFRGKLDIPTDVDRDDIDLSATELLNSILEPINALQNSPTCPWATQCRFAGGDRCSYAPATGDGRDIIVDIPGIDAVSATLPVSDDAGVGEGDYLQIESEIVLVTAVGSSSAAANARTATVATGLVAGTHWRATTAFATGPHANLAEAAELLLDQGATRLVIAPWFLAHGTITDRVAKFAAAQRIPMAQPLGAHRLVAETVLDRFDEVAAVPRAA